MELLRHLCRISFLRVSNALLQNGETLAAHSADVNNNTEIEETMSTISFTSTRTNSVATSTAHSSCATIPKELIPNIIG